MLAKGFPWQHVGLKWKPLNAVWVLVGGEGVRVFQLWPKHLIMVSKNYKILFSFLG